MKKHKQLSIIAILAILVIGIFSSCQFLTKKDNSLPQQSISESNSENTTFTTNEAQTSMQATQQATKNETTESETQAEQTTEQAEQTQPPKQEEQPAKVEATQAKPQEVQVQEPIPEVGNETISQQPQQSQEPPVVTQSPVVITPAQPITNGSGIFSQYYDQATQRLNNMTLDEKIGQVLLVAVPNSNAQQIVQQKQFGGYIIFAKDAKGKTVSQMQSTIKSWNDSSKIPLIVAVDEEGGNVVRISSNPNLAPHRFQSSQALFKANGYEAIKNDTIEKNQLLYSLGINVNLAPVADVSTNPNDYIYARTFGRSAAETAEYIRTVISAGKSTNVSNVLKHFPGYGSNVDTHTGIARDNRTLQYFRENDFLPFIAGINEGVESIMVSHNIITNVDPSLPASVSGPMHQILRQELGFTGIIMTDSLSMAAIKNYVSKPNVEALKAGNDMLIVTDYDTAIAEIRSAIQNGTLDEGVLDRAVTQVLAWKYYKKMM